MTTSITDIYTVGIDTKSLATLIIALNIARRNAIAYPKGHPVIAASLLKVLQVYDELLKDHDELILGVTGDFLLLNGTALEKTNQVYHDFAHALFERGIGAVLFHRGVTVDELGNFSSILAYKREQIFKYGGIEEVWKKADITAISIRAIRYDLFKSTDIDAVTYNNQVDSEEGLWHRFARHLSLEELPDYGDSKAVLDPEIIAELLNKKFVSGKFNETEMKSAIGDFLQHSETEDSFGDMSLQPFNKMATFISSLTPELRRQFLNSTFGDKNPDRQNIMNGIINNLSENIILETLEEISSNRLNVSPIVFGLLQRLGQNNNSPQNSSDISIENDNLAEKMKTIFREHPSEEFVPDDYQNKLNHIIAVDQISRINMEYVSDALITMENVSIENSIGQILLNLMRAGIETPEERELLIKNQNEMFSFYLQTGDYEQLHKMLDQLNDTSFPIEVQYRLREKYEQHEYLLETVDGLIIWGKSRYEDIRNVILKIGAPFIEILLDRLSEETNMSLRRFYISCLIDMGSITQQSIYKRLKVTNWFFLRNLLFILATDNDQASIPFIRPLLRSEDSRFRHEALKTLVKLGDSQAEKQIMDDLNSQNHDQQLAAILMAEHCKSSIVAKKLTNILSLGGYSQPECDKKSAIIHTLGEIGRAEILPELAKILGSKSILHSRQLLKLKNEIVTSFLKYPPNVCRPILEHIANSSSEISTLAKETLKLFSGKQI